MQECRGYWRAEVQRYRDKGVRDTGAWGCRDAAVRGGGRGLPGRGDAGVQVTGGGDTGVQEYEGGGVEIPRCVTWRVLGTVAGGFRCPR